MVTINRTTSKQPPDPSARLTLSVANLTFIRLLQKEQLCFHIFNTQIFFSSSFKTLKSQLHLNVSLVGTFEFASAASLCRAVHLINVIAPVIVPTVDIRPTNLTHKV